MTSKMLKGIASKWLMIIISIVGVIIFFVIVLMLSQKYLPGLWEGLSDAIGGLFGR